MQGNDPDYLQAAACAKHFAVHSGPESDRHHFNAIVSKQDLSKTYLPAFRAWSRKPVSRLSWVRTTARMASPAAADPVKGYPA